MLAKKTLANTGIEVSVLGLGSVKLGRDQGVKYPENFTIPNDRQAAKLIALASDLGINLIDTAPAYGSSEERLGNLLQGQRNNWVICSKVGEEFTHGSSSYNFSAQHTRFSIERSLRRLQTDVIDIVLVHSDGSDIDIINRHGTLDVLADLKQAGLIKAYGMSTKTVEGGLLAAQKSDCVMLTYNLTHRQEQPVLDYCREHNVAVLLKKALASGHICTTEAGEDRVQASMDFIFSHTGVTSAIIGTINPEHLRANVAKAQKCFTLEH